MSHVQIHGGHGPTPGEVRLAFMDAAEHQMKKALAHVEGEIVRRAPFRTGHLRRSFTNVVRRDGHAIIGTVGTNVFYGRFLEFGTGLYGPENRKIVPKRASALRFPAGGGRSNFVGGRRGQGTAGPGFTLAGRVRKGAAGGQAQFVFRRSVKGVHPMRFVRDGVEVTRIQTERTLQAIPAEARRLLEGRL